MRFFSRKIPDFMAAAPRLMLCLALCLAFAQHDAMGDERAAGSNSARALEQFNAALSQIASGDRTGAAARLEQAISLTPQWWLARLEYAANNLEMGRDPSGSLEHLKYVIQRSPENPRAYYYTGVSQEMLGNLPEAEKAYLACVKSKPSYSEAHLALGRIYRGQERYKEAAGHLESALEQVPGNTSARLILVVCYESMKDLDNAESQLRTLVMLSPENAYNHYRLAQFYERNGMPEKAAEEFKISERLSPTKDNRKLRPLLPSKK
jgi:tetratricopeptide (TPR) repeat protein